MYCSMDGSFITFPLFTQKAFSGWNVFVAALHNNNQLMVLGFSSFENLCSSSSSFTFARFCLENAKMTDMMCYSFYLDGKLDNVLLISKLLHSYCTPIDYYCPSVCPMLTVYHRFSFLFFFS